MRWRPASSEERAESVEFAGADPLAFVVSLNLHRRHLSESQRAIVAGKLANLTHGGDRRSEQAPNLGLEPPATLKVTAQKAAEMLNVGRGTVEAARAVQRAAAPEIVKAVETGRVAVSAAAQVARRLIAEQQAV